MTSRGLLIGLLISLALNFFLLGAGATVVVIGARVAKMRAAAAATPGPLSPIRRATMALPPGPRHAFGEAMKAAVAAQNADVQTIRQLRLEAWTAFSADKADVPAIKAKLDKARALEMSVRANLDAGVIDSAAALPQAQRAAIAQEMRPQPKPQQQPAANPAASESAAP